MPAGDARRPYTWVNMVSTVDGKTTLAGMHEPIGSRVDRTLMRWVRGPADAVVRGAETVRAAPYYPRAATELEDARTARGQDPQPLAVVVTASCRLPLEAAFFREAPRRPLILTAAGADPGRVAGLRRLAAVEIVGEGERVDLPAALELLRTRYGVSRLLSEGGPRLNYELCRHELLDELFWTVAPKIAGSREDLTMVEGATLLAPLPRLELLAAYAHESELFLRYRVRPAVD